MNNQEQMNKEKLVLANRPEMQFDDKFQTKPIGYYKDAWLRFKKNKASVIAALILIILITMAIIGPFLRDDRLYNEHVTLAQRLVSQGELPPKIKGLEWIPIFSGQRSITRSNLERDLRPLEDPEVIELFGKILLEDLDTIRPAADGTVTVRVDYYNFVNYKLSTPYWDRDVLGNPFYNYSAITLSTRELRRLLEFERNAFQETGEYLGVVLDFQRVTTSSLDRFPSGFVVNSRVLDPITRADLGNLYEWQDILLGDDKVDLVEGGSHRITVNFFLYLELMYDFTPNYWFGVDQRGRDWFNVLWNGARISLLIAITVSLVNIAIGVVIGSISGYFGGAIDLAIERISEIIAGIPFLALITLLILRYGSSIGVVIIAFTLTGWLGIASVTRREFYRYKNREYVLAARTLGATDVRIMSRHILPNAVGTMITVFVLYIPSVIFSESTFSYLGIINYGDVTSVGRMLADAQPRLRVEPALGFLILFPSIFVSLLMLSFNLFGNGLRDAFNPSLRGVEE
jgi:oligopeptide transport system permease protein